MGNHYQPTILFLESRHLNPGIKEDIRNADMVFVRNIEGKMTCKKFRYTREEDVKIINWLDF